MKMKKTLLLCLLACAGCTSEQMQAVGGKITDPNVLEAAAEAATTMGTALGAPVLLSAAIIIGALAVAFRQIKKGK